MRWAHRARGATCKAALGVCCLGTMVNVLGLAMSEANNLACAEYLGHGAPLTTLPWACGALGHWLESRGWSCAEAIIRKSVAVSCVHELNFKGLGHGAGNAVAGDFGCPHKLSFKGMAQRG